MWEKKALEGLKLGQALAIVARLYPNSGTKIYVEGHTLLAKCMHPDEYDDPALPRVPVFGLSPRIPVVLSMTAFPSGRHRPYIPSELRPTLSVNDRCLLPPLALLADASLGGHPIDHPVVWAINVWLPRFRELVGTDPERVRSWMYATSSGYLVDHGYDPRVLDEKTFEDLDQEAVLLALEFNGPAMWSLMLASSWPSTHQSAVIDPSAFRGVNMAIQALVHYYSPRV